MLKKIINSASLMTWANLLAKSSNLIILMPVVLSVFNAEDIVIWYLYFTIASLQMLIDLGFLPTFTRLFSYANSGLSMKEIYSISNNDRKRISDIPNSYALQCIFLATKKVYIYLAILSLILSLTIGSWLVAPVILEGTNPSNAWLGWIVVCGFTSLNLYSNSLVSLLTGLDKVAVVQRYQMISSLIAVVLSAVLIYFTHSLVVGVISYFSSYLINFIINIHLVKSIYKFENLSVSKPDISKAIKDLILPTAWRSGVGIISSAGIIQFSGILVARLENKSTAASYLIGLQLIRAASSFSQAPFYSRLPYLTKLFSQYEYNTLMNEAKIRIRQSLIVFLGIYFTIGISANHLLKLLNSDTKFMSLEQWILFGLAFLLERYGAMYLQIYTLTNHIIWHIANGITAIIMLIFGLLTYKYLGIYTFIASMLIGYIAFYTPYCVFKTYKVFSINFISFEKDNALPIIIAFLASSIILLLIK